MLLSFSTCWNSSRHKSGEDMLMEIADLGFRRVELGHGIRATLLPGIRKRKEKGLVEISSLHNFCPLPVEVQRASPNCYEFSSHRSSDRERAIRLTRQTIDYAERFEAKKVVLHLGTVGTMKNHTGDLIHMAHEGALFSKAYAEKKLTMVKEREARGVSYLQRVEECLKPIVEYAQSKNVLLGIECRDRYEEIPSEREIPALLERLGASAGYWHDIGHAQIKCNLGFFDHEEWLSRVGAKAIGCHLHDVKWPNQDHCPPFMGEIAYKKLMGYFPKECLFVLEISPKYTKHDILLSVEHWKNLFGS